jgi:acyl carrier protein
MAGLDEIQSWLIAKLSESLQLEPADLDLDTPMNRYGLNSIEAVSLSGDLEGFLGRRLSPTIFWDYPTINQLSRYLVSEKVDSSAVPSFHSRRVREEGTHPLTMNQRALWHLQNKNLQSSNLNLVKVARLGSKLDVKAFRRALEKLVSRHSALRTTFPAQNGAPVQVVHKTREGCFEEMDASSWSDAGTADRLTELGYSSFDLEKGPLMRICLIRRSEKDEQLLFAFHHLIMDYWSAALFLNELSLLYASERGEAQAALSHSSLSSYEHAHWEEEMIGSPEGASHLLYWKKQIEGWPALTLPPDQSSPTSDVEGSTLLSLKLTDRPTRQLNAFALSQGLSLPVILLSALKILLHRRTGQDEVVVGSLMACRGRAELAGTIGLLANPVPLRTNLGGNPSLLTTLRQVRRGLLEALKHEHYPYALLMAESHPDQDMSHSPVYQVGFNFLKSPRCVKDFDAFMMGDPEGIEMHGWRLFPLELGRQANNFDLLVIAAEVRKELWIAWSFKTALFRAETMNPMFDDYKILLEAILADPERKIRDYPVGHRL